MGMATISGYRLFPRGRGNYSTCRRKILTKFLRKLKKKCGMSKDSALISRHTWKKHEIDLPITNILYGIIYEGRTDVRDEMSNFMQGFDEVHL